MLPQVCRVVSLSIVDVRLLLVACVLAFLFTVLLLVEIVSLGLYNLSRPKGEDTWLGEKHTSTFLLEE